MSRLSTGKRNTTSQSKSISPYQPLTKTGVAPRGSYAGPNVRKGVGFRMPACRELSASGEGRRPKASQEGTRGPPSRLLPAMGI